RETGNGLATGLLRFSFTVSRLPTSATVTIRPPAVAGMFYEARAERLEKDVRSYLAAGGAQAARPAFGAIVPHAGYVYSGPVAGAVYARVAIPGVVVILCQNHTGRGAAAALDPSE